MPSTRLIINDLLRVPVLLFCFCNNNLNRCGGAVQIPIADFSRISFIPVINLIKEMKERNISTVISVPTVFCKTFEDNSGALELAKSPKMRPRTKHLHLVYHHFREHVCKRIVQLFPISTNFQLADIYTKPLPKELFIKFRKSIMGW